jgi:ribonuclease HI
MTIVAALRIRGTRTTFRPSEGGAESLNFKSAHDLAHAAMSNDPDEYIADPDTLFTEVPSRYQVQGVSIANTSQATFYAAIRATRPTPERMKTVIMLDKTRYAIQAQCGKTLSDEDIWKSIRHKDIGRKIRNFLWRGLHETYKCGNYWRNIPTFEHWAICPVCNVDETMEHILLECNAPGQKLIWNLCRELWKMKFPEMPDLCIGLIFGCGLAEIKNSKGKKMMEANRLFKILVTESAFLIWKFRCDRLMSRKSYHSDSEIHNSWIACINKRLKIDRLLTDTSRYGSRALDIKTVLKTWDGVLMDNKNLPDNWIWQSGVLVGIGKFRPPGRNR